MLILQNLRHLLQRRHRFHDEHWHRKHRHDVRANHIFQRRPHRFPIFLMVLPVVRVCIARPSFQISVPFVSSAFGDFEFIHARQTVLMLMLSFVEE